MCLGCGSSTCWGLGWGAESSQFKPQCRQNTETAKVPVSRVANPQKRQTGDSARGIPCLHTYVYPLHNLKRDKGVKNKRKQNVNVCSSVPLVYPPWPLSSSSFRVTHMRWVLLKVSPCSEVGFPAQFGSVMGQVLDHFKTPGCNRCFINRSRLNWFAIKVTWKCLFDFNV